MNAFPIRSLATVALLVLASLTPVGANPVGGALSGVNRAPAYGVAVHQIIYRGGEQADFSIVGDGDTALNIVVRDASGYEVVRTSGPGDRARVTWRPATTGVYYIAVVNTGGVYNEYRWLAY